MLTFVSALHPHTLEVILEEKYCEIFRTGKHTSANGVTKDWTTGDLDTMVKNFYEKNPDVPLVVGHPKTNDPAFGWFKDVKRIGEKLYACFKQVAPEFAEAVNSGKLKTRSISVYPDGTIRHLGWLGAMPPAVKGLAGFQFQEDENAECYEFSELQDFKFTITGGIFERIRDFFIGKFGLETTDKLISHYEIEKLKEIENKTPAEVDAVLNHSETSAQQGVEKENNMPDSQEPAQTLDFARELKQRDETIAALRAEKEEMEKRSRREKHLQFAEKAVVSGNITPAQKDAIAEFMEVAYKADTADGQDFAENDENTVSNKFKTFIGGLKQINFSETNPDDVDEPTALDFNDPAAVSEAVEHMVEEYKAKGKTISESQALQKLKSR